MLTVYNQDIFFCSNYRVINGGKSKLNEDQSTSKQFFIKKKSVRNGAASTEIPLEPITDGGPVSCITYLISDI